MNNRRPQHVSESDSSNKQSSISVFNLITDDLIIYIFSKLPVKSIARCRCVSKRWSFIIRRPNFKLLFPITSQSAQPRLLFAVEVAGKLFFNSSPQPQNPDVNSSLVATHHRKNSSRGFYKFCQPINGFICRQHVGKNYTFAVVSNPMTGQYLVSPKLRVGEGMDPDYQETQFSFGYDPIEKQFKVLCMNLWRGNGSYNWSGEYSILTLGTTQDLIWRKIQCFMIHYPLLANGICINGVLYYPAKINESKYMMFCFDVRSEEFSFVNLDQDLATKELESSILLNYRDKGKLGVLRCFVNHIELWVLEDAEKHDWSKHIYQMHHLLEYLRSGLCCAGMTSSGDIVLYMYSTCSIRDRYSIVYYNLEKNIMTRVRAKVPVFEEFDYCKVHAFTNYVENVELIM